MDTLIPHPGAGYDRPLDILDACHRRMRDESAALAWLCLYVEEHGVDDHAAHTARSIVNFFETVVAAHHCDEEYDVYPLVQRFCPSTELNAVRSLVARLRADHRKLDALWADMRLRLRQLAAGDRGALTPDAASAFADACRHHVALEEGEMMPLVRRVLDPRMVSRLGGSMSRRRTSVAA
ncbi:MAG TPA: hemerythrin domain-containing protein [Usitatibacter sp.]|nr:hemerythrin domain-containing protein [Usitatibacter sp.]